MVAVVTQVSSCIGYLLLSPDLLIPIRLSHVYRYSYNVFRLKRLFEFDELVREDLELLAIAPKARVRTVQ